MIAIAPPSRPNYIESKHWQEWLASGVNPEIIAANVQTVFDTHINPHTHEPSYPIAEFLNWKVTRFGYQARENQKAWVCRGLDPLNQWQRMEWGCLKLDRPRLDQGKAVKYEHPAKTPTRALFLAIPSNPRFWLEVLANPKIPIIIVEGAKKAGCLLSLGYVAIALPGVFGGYRKETQKLIEELALFAVPGRPVYICFDCDRKPKTVKNVNLATSKLGRFFTVAGCQVKVIQLPGPEKGVDDFVMARGYAAFDLLYKSAATLEQWQSSELWALTHTPALVLNQRYLGALPFPSTGLVCVRSPKGTGKTQALQPLIHEASSNGRRTLVVTHRVQLGRAICEKVGLPYIEERHSSEVGDLLGYGLCVDSLHPASQARFDPQDWKGAIVVLDEVEQVIWHALNSRTCQEKRVPILESLRELVGVVLSSGGLIVAQDADLSDVTINYLKKLAGDITVEPWLVLNQWKPKGCKFTFFNTPTPAPLLRQIEQVLQQGAVYIAVDSQKVKGTWSSQNLEAQLKAQYPNKRILRVDSQTVGDPTHPAFGIAERINEAIASYDIVICTPTIGTGVSIDLRSHFAGVFGIFQGAIPDPEARQALARVREEVPRYVWAKKFGPGKIGNGSTNYWEVAQSTTRGLKHNLDLLRDIEFDLDTAHDPVTLRTWATMAARVNSSMWSYREALQRGLEAEGHSLMIVDDDDPHNSKQLHEEMLTVRDSNQQLEAEAVAASEDVTQVEYEHLKDKRSKTPEERNVERKYVLHQRYGIQVSPELKLKDDDGWYPQLRLHYLLIHEPELVKQRDRRELEGHLERGNGKVAAQDVRLLTAQVEALKRLGIQKLFDCGKDICASDVQELAELAKWCRRQIKDILGVTISDEMTPIQIIQILLSKMGLKLKCLGQRRIEGKPIRFYRFEPPQDERWAVFEVWRKRDELERSRIGSELSLSHPSI